MMASRPVLICSLALLGGLVLGVSRTRAAQTPPPISGVTGTIALEGTVDQEYGAANTVVVKTVDGVEHVFHAAKNLLVHGGKGTGIDALKGLRAGSTVVVHYTAAGSEASAHEIDRVGDDGLKISEGVVTRIDRKKKEIAIRFDNGKTETFLLTDRAAVDVGKDVDKAVTGATRIVVYYSDEAGHKVAHFFKAKS